MLLLLLLVAVPTPAGMAFSPLLRRQPGTTKDTVTEWFAQTAEEGPHPVALCWGQGAGGATVAVGCTVAVGSSVAVGHTVAVGGTVAVGRAVEVGIFVAAGFAVCRAGCAGTGGSAESDEGGVLPGSQPLAAANSSTRASAVTVSSAPIPAPSPSARRSRPAVSAACLVAS